MHNPFESIDNRLALIERSLVEIKHDILSKISVSNPEMIGMLDKNITGLEFSTRTRNILRDNKVLTFRQLVEMGGKNFLRFRNAGKSSLVEIEKVMESHGINWPWIGTIKKD